MKNVTNVVRIFAPPLLPTSWLTSDREYPPHTFQQRVAPMTPWVLEARYFGVRRSKIKIARHKKLPAWVLHSCECWLLVSLKFTEQRVLCRVRVEFFTNEKSFKERLQVYFVKNQRSSTYLGLLLSPVHTSNNVEATLSNATMSNVASTLLPFW